MSGLKFSAFLAHGLLVGPLAEFPLRQELVGGLRWAGVTKVYLDAFRGCHPPEPLLEELRDFFVEEGFEVGGGITTVPGLDFGTRASDRGDLWLCYTSRTTREHLAGAVEAAACVFDEIIVDDFLCTMCRCPSCDSARGQRTWPEFYKELMVEAARELIVGPARRANSRVRLVIKYPQWYDRFHDLGYDVGEQPDNFDGVWVGTETRDRELEYVEPYEAFFNYRWLVAAAGDKVGGAWFDQIRCYPEVYLEQAYQSVLAGASELVLFTPKMDWAQPANANLSALVQHQGCLRLLAEALHGRRHLGVTAYKPPNSDAAHDKFLFDVMGTWGVPLVPASTMEPTPSLILAAHAAADDGWAAYADDVARRGGSVLLTSGLISRSPGAGVALAGLSAVPEPPAQWVHRFRVEGRECRSSHRVEIPHRLNPGEADVVAEGMSVEGWFPLVTARRLGEGTVLCVAVHGSEFEGRSGEVVVPEPMSAAYFPEEVLANIRKPLLAPLGLSFSAGNRVALYPFEGGLHAVANFGDREAQVTLGAEGHFIREHLMDLHAELAGDGWRITVPPRTTILVEFEV